MKNSLEKFKAAIFQARKFIKSADIKISKPRMEIEKLQSRIKKFRSVSVGRGALIMTSAELDSMKEPRKYSARELKAKLEV